MEVKMKRFSFILVLSIIFTGYLFSQSEENKLISQVEENEIIEMYTLTKANTIVATETGTTIFSEPANEQDEKKDFKKYDFYNDYLADLKKTSFIHSDIEDTLAINECKETGIILVELFGNPSMVGLSATLDIPISCNINIASICSGAIGGVDGGSPVLLFLGAGVGYVFVKTDYFILRSRACLGLLRDQGKDNGLIDRPGLNLGADILFRVKFIALSIGPDFFVPLKGRAIYKPANISFGLGIVY